MVKVTTDSGLRVLDRLAWDFDEYDTTDSFSHLHWYPATFVPQLPRVLISALSEPGDIVLDPFCGTGTVLVEAVNLNRTALGSDLNPIARMITRARLALTTADPEDFSRRISDHTVGACFELSGAQPLSPNVHPLQPAQPYPHAAMDELADWYHPETLREFTILFSAIRSIAEPDVRAVMLAIASSVARALSSQTKSWGHIADNVKPKAFTYKGVRSHFLRAVAIVQRALLKRAASPSLRSSLHLLLAADARSLPLRPDSVDLALTSFPYPGMSDYILAHRLSMLWLGLSPDAHAIGEIGARRKRFRRSALADFLTEMHQALGESVTAIRPGGHLAVVAPAYEQDDVRVSIIDGLLDGVPTLGLKEKKRMERFVPSRRKRQSWGTLQREAIVIWEKM